MHKKTYMFYLKENSSWIFFFFLKPQAFPYYKLSSSSIACPTTIAIDIT